LRHNCTIKRARQAVAKAARRMRHEVREGRPSGEPPGLKRLHRAKRHAYP
jgi:hypothetical protein